MSRFETPYSHLDLSKIPRSVLNRNFAFWAQGVGVKVDGYPFSFEGHRYLFPLFTDDSTEIVVMKSAQMGATIWMLLKAMHMAIYPNAWGYKMPVQVGFYFPTDAGLHLMVKSRVEPIILSTPDLAKYAPAQRSQGWKPFGPCGIYFFGMASKVNKDSTPLMILFYDEVRLMKLTDIAQTDERVSHSPLKYKHFVSTAGLPDNDIHKLFKNSDQKWFTTFCKRCNHEQVLAHNFPDCVATHEIGPKKGMIYYVCRKCGSKIDDTQYGRFLPHGDPKNSRSGYHFSQLISQRISAAEIWKAYKDTTNITEFWNAKLGMPFVDEDNRPVNYGSLDNNINVLISWGQESGGFNVMGVDQMMGLNYVVVLNRNGDRRRLVWFEVIEDKDPFKRTAEIFEEFSCKVCVCDAEPNANEALRFARNFKGKVFLAKAGSYEDAVKWHDHWKPSKGHKKANYDTYYQYRVFLDRYKSHEYTLNLLKDGRIEWPDPNQLIQDVRPLSGGRKEPMPILRTHAYLHWSSAVREKVTIDDLTASFKWRWVYTEGDPHSLDALCHAVYASERRSILFSDSLFV